MVFPAFSTPKIAPVAAERQALPVLRRGAGQLRLELGEIVEEALDAWRGIGEGSCWSNRYESRWLFQPCLKNMNQI